MGNDGKEEAKRFGKEIFIMTLQFILQNSLNATIIDFLIGTATKGCWGSEITPFESFGFSQTFWSWWRIWLFVPHTFSPIRNEINVEWRDEFIMTCQWSFSNYRHETRHRQNIFRCSPNIEYVSQPKNIISFYLRRPRIRNKKWQQCIRKKWMRPRSERIYSQFKNKIRMLCQSFRRIAELEKNENSKANQWVKSYEVREIKDQFLWLL